MSIENSYLTQPDYEYDMVVAVSQKAINNIIKTYYSNVAASPTPFAEQQYYFIKDRSGNPSVVDQAELLSSFTSGIDPLTVPAWNGTGTMPAKVSTLANSSFYFAFKFTPGDPTGVNQFTYLTIHPGTDSVTYYLLCKDIQVVFWNPDTKAWVNVTQSRANEFNINADVCLQNILYNDELSKLPLNIQNAVKDLGTTGVNVQQLIFDLDSAVVNPTTTLSGLDPAGSVFKPLMQQFATAYFEAYAAVWVPVLNYSVTQPGTSSLVPTSMNLYAAVLNDAQGNPITTNPTISQADLSTLNYLFGVNGDTLQKAAPFNWNWLEDNGVSPTPDLDPNADVNQYNGAIAIRRDSLAKFLETKLTSYALENCWVPQITLGTSMLQNEYDVEFTEGKPLFDPFQPFNINQIIGGSPDTLLQYWYNGNQTLNGWVDGDSLTITTHFDLAATVGYPEGDPSYSQTLTLSQAFYLEVNAVKAQDAVYTGSPVYKTYTDVFDIVVDAEGEINFIRDESKSSSADQSQLDNMPDYVAGALDNYIEAMSAAYFTEVPITMPKQFVFPGGNAFTFKDAMFSGYSDLVCHVTYKSES